MSILSSRWERRVVHAWLWRSQEKSPYYNQEKADRIYNRYQVTIETELIRLKIKILDNESILV